MIIKFPALWKIAIICPVFKKYDTADINNYRSISILSNFSKASEMFLHNFMFNNIKQHLSDNQHGFIPGRSTTTNLAIIAQELAETVDNNSHMDVLFTDFSRVFDSIDHLLLGVPQGSTLGPYYSIFLSMT